VSSAPTYGYASGATGLGTYAGATVIRKDDGSCAPIARQGDVVRLTSIGCEMAVSDIYENPLA
jgi:hypothetical protein